MIRQISFSSVAKSISNTQEEGREGIAKSRQEMVEVCGSSQFFHHQGVWLSTRYAAIFVEREIIPTTLSETVQIMIHLTMP